MKTHSNLSALSLERAVKCGCPTAFHLSVGLQPSVYREVSACLKCGALVVSELLTRHVHRNTYEPTDRVEIEINGTTAAWLDRWPRLFAGDNNDLFFLRHDTRCTTTQELSEVCRSAQVAQKDIPIGRRLRNAAGPSSPPPENLPEALSDFALLYEKCGLKPNDDLDQLLANADPRYPIPSPLAIDCILQRDDVRDVVLTALHSNDHNRRMTGCAIVSAQPNLIPFAAGELIRWLRGVCLTADLKQPERQDQPWHISAVIEQVRKWHFFDPSIEDGLRAVSVRIGRHDYELIRQINEVLLDLKGEAPLPISRTPWFMQS